MEDEQNLNQDDGLSDMNEESNQVNSKPEDTSTGNRINGKIKWYNAKKGFGFIEGEDGNDYFIHYTQKEKGVYLRENDPVTFEAIKTDKGYQAQNLKKVE